MSLQKILQEEYEKNMKTFLEPAALLSLIEEIMDAPKTKTITEDKSSGRIDWRAVPSIAVRELAWANLESNDASAAESRQEIQQWLEKIQGNDLQEKLQHVSTMLSSPEQAQNLVSQGATPGDRIASTISYLVFFKTLTTVITNFNASSAGFNFEAFLAVLLGGAQIPASGATTIADLTAKDGTPISLKLYAEKTVKAGGSYNDLVGDLTRRPMQYVVATKDLVGKSTNRSGLIKFYRYNLSADNICNILYHSADGHNNKLIRIPKAVIQGSAGHGLEFEIPERPSLAQTTARFEDALRGRVNLPHIEGLIAAIDFANNPSIFPSNGKPGKSSIRGVPSDPLTKSGSPKKAWLTSPLRQLLDAYKESTGVTDFDTYKLAREIYYANEEALEHVRAVDHEIQNLRGKGADYASPEDSLKFYNSLSTDSRKRALLFTYGWANTGNQYELRKADIKNISGVAAAGDPPADVAKVLPEGQDNVLIGELTIGQETIQSLLDALVNEVNQNVFEIFEQIASLQQSVQAYFASGLTKTSAADTAIEAAGDINTKTREIKTQHSS
jgi:hypothetical protein